MQKLVTTQWMKRREKPGTYFTSQFSALIKKKPTMINNNSGSNLAKVKKLFTRVLFFTAT
jgi:hypothetical protein